jgi:hypothetical protein
MNSFGRRSTLPKPANPSCPTLDEAAAVYRVLHLHMIDSSAASLLRELDRRELLGPAVMAVGTTATAAYQVEAASTFETPAHATRDIDLTWVSQPAPEGPVLWEALHTFDDTFLVNQERTFQARNRAPPGRDGLDGRARANATLPGGRILPCQLARNTAARVRAAKLNPWQKVPRITLPGSAANWSTRLVNTRS